MSCFRVILPKFFQPSPGFPDDWCPQSLDLDCARESSTDMVLNYDVLLHVLDYLVPSLHIWGSPIRAFPLMSACRTLYHYGIKMFLSGAILAPTQPKRIKGFCDYILSDPNVNRASYLRELRFLGNIEFGGNMFGPNSRCLNDEGLDITGRIALVLSRAHSLRCLSIYQIREFLEYDHNLYLAISSMKRLDHLYLHNVADTAPMQMVSEMRSPISAIHLSFHRSMFSPEPVRNGLFTALSPFSDHLQELSISSPPRKLCHDSKDHWTQFPKVHSLCLDDGPYDIHAPTLYHHFPNLRQLTINQTKYESLGFDELHSLHRGNVSSKSGWQHLEELTCAVRTAYVLALGCSIRSWGQFTLRSKDKGCFHHLLSKFRPSRLQFSVNNCTLSQRDIDDLIPPSPVTHLTLNVTLTPDTHVLRNEEEAMKQVLRWAPKFELQFLSVRIFLLPANCQVMHSREMVVEKYIQQLAQASRSLKYVSLSRNSDRLNPAAFWQVARDDQDSVHLEKVPKTEFEELTQGETSQ